MTNSTLNIIQKNTIDIQLNIQAPNKRFGNRPVEEKTRSRYE